MNENLDFYDFLFKSLTLLIVTISAIIAGFTLYKFHEWNRRKSTQEILKDLVLGEYPKFSKQLLDNGAKPYDQNETYETFINTLKTDDAKAQVTSATKSITNLYEFIAISLKNNVFDDNICYDYLGFMYKEFYRWSKPYIIEEQNKGKSNRILCNFTERAEKWTERYEKENKPKQIKGKRKL